MKLMHSSVEDRRKHWFVQKATIIVHQIFSTKTGHSHFYPLQFFIGFLFAFAICRFESQKNNNF